MNKILPIAILLVSLLIPHAKADELYSTAYINEQYGYQINFPINWTVEPGKNVDTKAVYRDGESVAYITIKSNLNLFGEKIENVTPEYVWGKMIEEVGEGTVKLIDSGRHELNGQEFIWLHTEILGDSAGMDVKFIFITDKYLHFLSGVVKPTSKYEQYKKTLAKSMESFELLDATKEQNIDSHGNEPSLKIVIKPNDTGWLEAIGGGLTISFLRNIAITIIIAMIVWFFKKNKEK